MRILEDSTKGRLLFVLSATVVLTGGSADAQSTNRGVWCWNTPSSPYGLDSIIGTNALQNAAVQQFKLWGIRRVYGSYNDQLSTSQG